MMKTRTKGVIFMSENWHELCMHIRLRIDLQWLCYVWLA